MHADHPGCGPGVPGSACGAPQPAGAAAGAPAGAAGASSACGAPRSVSGEGARGNQPDDARDAALWREFAPKWLESLNRRATVEQWMFDAARGKRPMPTKEDLRSWATRLGAPADMRRPLALYGGLTPATIANEIHYPQCWDEAAYPSLEHALCELFAWFRCGTCSRVEPQDCTHPDEELQHTGDGEPVLFCPNCGRNSLFPFGRSGSNDQAP